MLKFDSPLGNSVAQVCRSLFTVLILMLFTMSAAQAVTVNVVSADVTTPVTGFHWVLEEDNTHTVMPGNAGDVNMLSLGFHNSHSPVLASGTATGNSVGIPLVGGSTGRYFISVTPYTGQNMSGIAVVAAQDADIVTVTVNNLPLPTAQISVLAFHDNSPINGGPDFPAESGLAGFDVILKDAGGIYGIAGGQVIQDAFGNPLGTEYQYNASGQPILDADGAPLPIVDGAGDPILGSGVLKTDATGNLLIKNLVPAKYGIQVVPPPELAEQGWQQTSTIEGSKTVDAWVPANEPAFFKEFGPGAAGHHVFIGFVKRRRQKSRLWCDLRSGTSRKGVISLPQGASASTHILKPENQNQNFTYCPANEYFCSLLAKTMKLNVPKTYLFHLPEPIYLIERYDRKIVSDSVKRLHQIDVCQMLNKWVGYKYESHGGITLSDVIASLNKFIQPAIAREHVLNWIIFNYLIGNNDAHAKNISILITHKGMSVAPMYDLLCVHTYLPDSQMAMSIGGENKPGWIEARHWQALADIAKIPNRLMITYLKRQSESIFLLAEELVQSPGFIEEEKHFITQKILPIIKQRVAYVAESVSEQI